VTTSTRWLITCSRRDARLTVSIHLHCSFISSRPQIGLRWPRPLPPPSCDDITPSTPTTACRYASTHPRFLPSIPPPPATITSFARRHIDANPR
jgi:hypothetical protein